jgi:hypothetical protein
MLFDVLAVGLHPRVRSQINGSHYTSTDKLPLVPGIDGVGRGPDRLLRYFILPDTTMGSIAEKTVIDTRRSVVLPESADPVAVAAAMNPAMSSWIALRQRVQFPAGQNVLVLGATGNSGQLAHLDRDRFCRWTNRSDPLGRTARSPTADRRQRPRVCQHPGNSRRAARAGQRDHQRHHRHCHPTNAARRCRASLGRRREGPTTHRPHPAA